jgi:hypothetical protein
VIYVPQQAHSGDLNLALITITSLGNPTKQQTIELTTRAAWLNLFVPVTIK